jgi:cytochrome c-type biogenesis protein CcmH/NrfG
LAVFVVGTWLNTATDAAASVLADQARSLLEADKPRESLVYFEKALREDPRDLRIWEGLAEAHYRLGEFGEAARYADERLRRAPDDKVWRAEWAEIVFATASRQDEVLRAARGWFQQESSDRSAQVLLGHVLANLGEFEEARSLLQGSLIAAPDDVEALRVLASIEEWDQNFGGAREYLRRAHELKPENTEVTDDLTRITTWIGQLATARFEPTLPLIAALSGLAILFGLTSDRLGVHAYARLAVGASALALGALIWIAYAPVG